MTAQQQSTVLQTKLDAARVRHSELSTELRAAQEQASQAQSKLATLRARLDVLAPVAEATAGPAKTKTGRRG